MRADVRGTTRDARHALTSRGACGEGASVSAPPGPNRRRARYTALDASGSVQVASRDSARAAGMSQAPST